MAHRVTMKFLQKKTSGRWQEVTQIIAPSYLPEISAGISTLFQSLKNEMVAVASKGRSLHYS